MENKKQNATNSSEDSMANNSVKNQVQVNTKSKTFQEFIRKGLKLEKVIYELESFSSYLKNPYSKNKMKSNISILKEFASYCKLFAKNINKNESIINEKLLYGTYYNLLVINNVNTSEIDFSCANRKLRQMLEFSTENHKENILNFIEHKNLTKTFNIKNEHIKNCDGKNIIKRHFGATPKNIKFIERNSIRNSIEKMINNLKNLSI